MEHASSLSSLLQEGSSEIGVPLSAEQAHLFVLYLEQLQLWNRSINLTSITQDKDVIIKHFVDSLAALRVLHIIPGVRLLDIGTGAGFPGIPLKIAQPDLRVTLIEPARKRSSFLRFIIGLLQLKDVDVHEGTLDHFLSDRKGERSYHYITSRALNPTLLFQNSSQLLTQDGVVVLYTSQSVKRSTFPGNWQLIREYTFDLPMGYGHRTVSTFSLKI